MRILLIRHGESEGNANPRAYVEKGDHKVGLTEKGWQQAIAAGQFLSNYYAPLNLPRWPNIFVSSYQRPKETLSGAFHGMAGIFSGKPRVFEDPRLIEKHYGAENVFEYLAETEDEKTFANLMMRAFNHTQRLDPYATRRVFGDASKDTMNNVRSFLETLTRDMKEGKIDHMIFAHGAVMVDFVMAWAHLPMNSRNKVPKPGNCDIYEIEGEFKKWTIKKIYDGEEMKPANINILEGLHPFSYEDLPTVPEEFRLG